MSKKSKTSHCFHNSMTMNIIFILLLSMIYSNHTVEQKYIVLALQRLIWSDWFFFNNLKPFSEWTVYLLSLQDMSFSIFSHLNWNWRGKMNSFQFFPYLIKWTLPGVIYGDLHELKNDMDAAMCTCKFCPFWN